MALRSVIHLIGGPLDGSMFKVNNVGSRRFFYVERCGVNAGRYVYECEVGSRFVFKGFNPQREK